LYNLHVIQVAPHLTSALCDRIHNKRFKDLQQWVQWHQKVNDKGEYKEKTDGAFDLFYQLMLVIKINTTMKKPKSQRYHNHSHNGFFWSQNK
jgi:hypothetical protein